MSEKVRTMIAEMTVQEKIAQMIQVPVATIGMDEAREWAKRGAGSFLHVLGDDARELQRLACETRMGIPVMFGIDAIHGHGLNEKATIFPTQLSQACSWDPEMVRKASRATAEEVAADGLHWTFSPLLCLARDTRWGRVGETYGEDPYLTGELAAAAVKGYQGDHLSDDTSILACAKHYIGYGEATGAKDAYDTEMTYRKMKEVFLPPFARAVEAGCATVMTAYGSIDGVPFTVDKKTLTDILRGELGFDGILVTDWDNTRSLIINQHVCENLEDASEKAAAAGNDMIMTTVGFYEAALKAVESGRLSEEIIDRAVEHILNIKERMGLFEKCKKNAPASLIGCEAHLKTALDTARETVTLLTNNGILPLSKDAKVAVIGPNADDIRAQYGDWTYFTHPIPGIEKTPRRPYVTLLEGICAIAREAVYAIGCDVKGGIDRIDEAVACAKDADVIVLAVGDNYDQAGEYKDRADLSLSGKQDELFRRLKALGKPIVSVLIATKPLSAVQVAEESDAFICAFNGGMFGGQAVAEAIFGEINPAGRLPISFPRHSGQLPVYYNHLPGWHGGKYVDLPKTPLFAFGEGLSYTTFEYADLRFDPDKMEVSVRVKNTGGQDGAEVVQCYVQDPVGSVIRPVKNLAGFQRVSLTDGEEKTVQVKLNPEAFTVVLPDETRVVEPGEFIIMAGHSSKDEDLITVSIRM